MNTGRLRLHLNTTYMYMLLGDFERGCQNMKGYSIAIAIGVASIRHVVICIQEWSLL